DYYCGSYGRGGTFFF
nr:immunoglobulin light chain junction region [Macaca mulatta]